MAFLTVAKKDAPKAALMAAKKETPTENQLDEGWVFGSAGSMACSMAETTAETTAEPTDLRTESMTAANWDARSAAS